MNLEMESDHKRSKLRDRTGHWINPRMFCSYRRLVMIYFVASQNSRKDLAVRLVLFILETNTVGI